MSRTRLTSFVISLLAASIAAQATAQDLFDTEASAGLEAYMRAGFQAADSGNFSFWQAARDDVVLFDIDSDNNPVAMYGQEAWNGYLQRLDEMLGTTGGSVATTINQVSCHSTASIGYCTLEFDQTFTMNGETMGPVHCRGTAIAAREGEGWSVLHWHGSFSQWPEMPETAAPTE